MRYRIRHTTQYRYDHLVTLCKNEARLVPLSNERQTCLKSRFLIKPRPEDIHQRTDYYGNQVAFFEILHSHRELSVTAISDVEVSDKAPVVSANWNLSWEDVVALILQADTEQQILVREWTLPSVLIPNSIEVKEYAELSFTAGRSLLDACTDLMHRIYHDFKYDPNVTTVNTPLSEVLENRHGVCQDFAHLGIASVRAMGLPARYVSGYLETLPPEGEEKLVGSDASHAWFEVFCGDSWMAFDPTNDQAPTEQYVLMAIGRDFADVTPLKGVVYGAGEHQLSVSVDMRSHSND